MNSIVEYNSAKLTENNYPERIISPPKSGLCCLSHMEQVGDPCWERESPFVYRRCNICGFTVRHFPSGVGRLSFEASTRSKGLHLRAASLRRGRRRSNSRRAVSTHETIFDEGVRFALVGVSGRDLRLLAGRLEAMAG